MTSAASMRNEDHDYERLVSAMRTHFENAASGGPLFTTDAEGLFEAYLAGFPEDDRQYHNCNACRRFIERFGGLVTIDADGVTHAAIWPLVEGSSYWDSVAAVAERVLRAKVTGVFLASESVWGTPSNPRSLKQGAGLDWTHLHVLPPRAALYRGVALTAGQAAAEKREERGMVLRAVAEFRRETVAAAVRVLSADALYRSEKVLGAAEWLLQLHDLRAEQGRKQERENLTWLAIAKAPAGFCHPRSSMIGTLLEDIEAGKDFDACARAFAAKMHPLRYQRPQAAPSAGNIKQAEELFAKLGLAPALPRRFARLDEIQAIWRPTLRAAAPPSGGVFSHLNPKGEAPLRALELPATKMTWTKFESVILPEAREIECAAPSQGAYCGLVTAVDPLAPPLLQWDSEAQRNPFSWYLWMGGSTDRQFGIHGWTPVDALTRKPPAWFDAERHKHQGDGIVVVLRGAKDSREPSGCLFPEILKAELHGVRATIEAFSRGAKLGGREEASACGLMLAGDQWSARLRVTDASGDRRTYEIDRRD
jgi:hypothetical protein